MKMYIARDWDGALTLFFEAPPYKGVHWGEVVWIEDSNWFPVPLSDDCFPEVTFENSPQEVELKLIEK